MRGWGEGGTPLPGTSGVPPPSPTPPCSSSGLVHGQCQGVWGVWVYCGSGVIYVRNEVAPRCSFGGWGVQQHRLPAHKRATALHSQKEIKADHKPECPVLSAFRQSLHVIMR